MLFFGTLSEFEFKEMNQIGHLGRDPFLSPVLWASRSVLSRGMMTLGVFRIVLVAVLVKMVQFPE